MTELNDREAFKAVTQRVRFASRLTKDLDDLEVSNLRSVIAKALSSPDRITKEYEGFFQESWNQERRIPLFMGGRNNRFKNVVRGIALAAMLSSPWPIRMQSSYLEGMVGELSSRWPEYYVLPWEGRSVGPLVKLFTWPMDRVLDFFEAETDPVMKAGEGEVYSDDDVVHSVYPFGFTLSFKPDYTIKDHRDLNYGVNPYIEIHIDRTDDWELDLSTYGLFVQGADGYYRIRKTNGPNWADPEGFWMPWRLIPIKSKWAKFSDRLKDQNFTDKVFAEIAQIAPIQHPHLKWKTAPEGYSGGIRETDLIDYPAYFLPNSVLSLVNPARDDLQGDLRAQLPAEFVLSILNTPELMGNPKRMEYYDKLMESPAWREIFRGAYGISWEVYRAQYLDETR